jgi:hypothetical protein
MQYGGHKHCYRMATSLHLLCRSAAEQMGRWSALLNSSAVLKTSKVHLSTFAGYLSEAAEPLDAGKQAELESRPPHYLLDYLRLIPQDKDFLRAGLLVSAGRG